MRPNSVTYKPEFCDLVIALGMQGKSLTQMAAAIGCTMRAFKNWEKGEPGHPNSNHPEFTEALALARVYAQAWWEDDMQKALHIADGKTAASKATIYKIALPARFPHDYRETTRTELTGADGGPVNFETKSNEQILAAMSPAERAALATDPKIAALFGIQQQGKTTH